MDTSKTPPLEVAATKWRHWYMKGPDADTSAELCADKVKNAFMARYKWPDDQPEMKDKWMKTLENCCAKLTTQLIYQVRIYAVMVYHAEVLHQAIKFDDAKVIHLESNEYRRVPFGTWVNTEPWFKLSDLWGSRQFKNISTVKRNARLSKPNAVNRGGSRSVARTQQCMEEKYGRPFSLIESFAVHMGAPKEAVAQGQGNELPPLRNEHAQEHLDNYRSGMMETYGPDVSWVRGPFDPQVMYDNTRRKPHGKFAIADGAFDSSKVQMSTIAVPSHSQTSSHNEIRLAQEVQELKRQRQQDQQQRQEDQQSMLRAFVQFNQQVAQYYSQGQTHLPPPQLNLASIFPTHGSPGAEQDGMNNSTNGGRQRQGGNNSMYTPQDDPTSSQYMNDADRDNYDEQAELERWFGPSISRI